METRRISGEELAETLTIHAVWKSGPGGVRANLGGLDLRGVDFSREDLAGVDMEGADLRGANLSGTNFHSSFLDRSNFDGANLRGAVLTHAYLDRASLRGADLEKANLERASLRRADLEGANLKSANLYKAYLDKTNMFDVCFTNANLEDVNFGDTSLSCKVIPGGTLALPYDVRVLSDEWVSIGCTTHVLSYWLKYYQQMGENKGLRQETIDRYGRILESIRRERDGE